MAWARDQKQQTEPVPLSLGPGGSHVGLHACPWLQMWGAGCGQLRGASSFGPNPYIPFRLSMCKPLPPKTNNLQSCSHPRKPPGIGELLSPGPPGHRNAPCSLTLNICLQISSGRGVCAANPLPWLLPKSPCPPDPQGSISLLLIWPRAGRVGMHAGTCAAEALTVVAAPVDVDAAPVVAGELGQWEAGRVG